MDDSNQKRVETAAFAYKIKWSLFGPIILALPLCGLGFCVIYSIIYNFDEANATHCNVSMTKYPPLVPIYLIMMFILIIKHKSTLTVLSIYLTICCWTKYQ